MDLQREDEEDLLFQEFANNIMKFVPLLENKQVVIWGTGKSGKIGGLVLNKFNIMDYYYVDNNSKRWGNTLLDKEIYSPSRLLGEHKSNVVILVSSMFWKEISAQLLNYGFIKEKHFHVLFHTKSPKTVLKQDPMAGGSLVVSNFDEIILRVETTNHCNFQCSFCPHSQLKRPKQFINDLLYQKIICEAAELGFKNLDLRNMGEPLIDSSLVTKTLFAKHKGFEKIYIHTNGFLLKRELFEDLYKAGMTYFIVSLSPKSEFDASRGPGNYKRIIKNLEDISHSDYKDAIVIDFINSGNSSETAINQFRQYIYSLGFSIREEIMLHNWAEGQENVRNEYKPCHRVWTSLTVLVDGSICICCLDYEGKIKLGNLNNEDLWNVINSPQYQEIRRGHLLGKLPNICYKCNMPYVKGG